MFEPFFEMLVKDTFLSDFGEVVVRADGPIETKQVEIDRIWEDIEDEPDNFEFTWKAEWGRAPQPGDMLEMAVRVRPLSEKYDEPVEDASCDGACCAPDATVPEPSPETEFMISFVPFGLPQLPFGPVFGSRS